MAKITNTCNHCGNEFVDERLISLCLQCFIAGHRYNDCGSHCRTTAGGETLGQFLLRETRANAELAKRLNGIKGGNE